MPPEAIKGEDISQSWNVYSFGVLLWELWTHKLPFTDVKQYQLRNKIVEGLRPQIPKVIVLCVMLSYVVSSFEPSEPSALPSAGRQGLEEEVRVSESVPRCW